MTRTTLSQALLLAGLLLSGSSAHAWWNDEWGYRKPLTLDTTPTGADIKEPLTGVPVLVRLHTGNFTYFVDVQGDGKDVRLIAGDDKTPLKFHFEKFDPVNQMALLWVTAPNLAAANNSEKLWMYYGNPAGVDAQDVPGVYDVNQGLVYHFDEPAPKDKTAYGNHPASFTAEINNASLIGSGARFTGTGALTVAANPALALTAQSGWTFSTWIKIDQPQSDAVVVALPDPDKLLTLAIDGTNAYAKLDAPGNVLETPKTSTLTPGKWQHLTFVATATQLRVLLDGTETAKIDGTVPEFTGALTIGAAADGSRGLTAEIDEVQVAKTARSAEWIKAAARGQGVEAALLSYGEDQTPDTAEEGGESSSYFGIILQNVTLDGWVVIGLCVVLGVVSWIVMALKSLLINRIHDHNQEFLTAYHRLGTDKAAQESLDAEDDPDAEDASLLESTLFTKNDDFRNSSLYRIYHVGMREVHHRVGTAVGAQASSLEGKALISIKAALDTVVLRETQKLNAQMVLLTIAISGGPFLGLLGTVVGVMITFAAIAATGDVNINAIAPGIAASLMATIAGLGVAIPALFGYNYLGSRIKDEIADMHAFTDEFVAKLGETYG